MGGWGWGGGASIDFYVVTIPAMDSVIIDIQLIMQNSSTVSCFTVKKSLKVCYNLRFRRLP